MVKWIKKFFKIDERDSNVRVEVIGGITTFLAMAYILFVNPNILSAAGMPLGGVFLATALAAAFGTLLMGLWAKLPVALAPGMGLNAFFAFTLVLGMGFSWQEALAAIFVSGIIYLVISIIGWRKKIVASIPKSMKYAVAAGIGFFIAFIGLVNGGIIVSNAATLVGLGALNDPAVLLAIGGIVFTIILLALKVKAAVFFGLAGTLIVNILLVNKGVITFMPANEIKPSFSVFGGMFSQIIPIITSSAGWVAILSFLFVDFFDTAGTLMAVTGQMEFLTEEDIDRANIVDATSTIAGSIFGTSTTTSYIESLSGVGVGARTGLSSVVVAIMFLVSLVAYPLLPYVSGSVTAAAMVIVGTMMATSIGKIDWNDWAIGISAFITILIMILSYSISEGIGFGFITFSVAMLASKRGKEVSWIFYLVSILFLLHYIFL
jgi:adenine/guanine/hypoxanthine permease